MFATRKTSLMLLQATQATCWNPRLENHQNRRPDWNWNQYLEQGQNQCLNWRREQEWDSDLLQSRVPAEQASAARWYE
ncbi:hypothetical protein CVT26_014375 [Gymnopilus dilepis]|uniref:Uncharacterized protein n=1 Tax=Gymnopilus dilepis TaxID=231916 RepID=A0A409Y7Q0_9AGAR|nr:hypothetical protein CVT26_014375 [Gymnopilus dilepis]